jgi:hypothetical protein
MASVFSEAFEPEDPLLDDVGEPPQAARSSAVATAAAVREAT